MRPRSHALTGVPIDPEQETQRPFSSTCACGWQSAQCYTEQGAIVEHSVHALHARAAG